MPLRFRLLVGSVLVLAGCAGSRPEVVPLPPPTAEPAVTLTILQLNDVYEITPVEAGRTGGLARVATLRQRLLEEDPNTITVIAGDFYSPSALGTARVDGQRLNGRQMVAVLNALGLDVATFGNHEFDIAEADFYQRLAESEFVYVSANVTDSTGALFPKSRRSVLLPIEDETGAAMTLGITGVTLPSNPKPYVRYAPALAAMQAEVGTLAQRADVIVGLTHLALEDDIAVAEMMPEVDLVLGGHEHENILVYRGPDFTPILKADANARTVYVHRLRYAPESGALDIDSELVRITAEIPEDSTVAAEVARWVEAGYAGFRESGFEPEAVVAVSTEPLDGLEASVRNQPTALAELIAQAYLAEAGDAELAVFNSGSIRIDDVLPPGPVTEYDVIRILPFGGEVVTVTMPGSLLDSTLTQGVANRGTGGFLQTANVTRDEDGAWLVGGQPIDPARIYRVATSDFLISGLETGLAYLNAETNPNLTLAATHRDVRRALIEEMRRRYGSPAD